jgi:hypothetical protein
MSIEAIRVDETGLTGEVVFADFSSVGNGIISFSFYRLPKSTPASLAAMVIPCNINNLTVHRILITLTTFWYAKVFYHARLTNDHHSPGKKRIQKPVFSFTNYHE